jgi:uncharacterized membrane protein
VLPLLGLQALSLVVMASLDSLSEANEGTFAVFLAVDLISFAVVAHLYRLARSGETPSRYFILAALAAIVALLLSSLALA